MAEDYCLTVLDAAGENLRLMELCLPGTERGSCLCFGGSSVWVLCAPLLSLYHFDLFFISTVILHLPCHCPSGESAFSHGIWLVYEHQIDGGNVTQQDSFQLIIPIMIIFPSCVPF